MRVEWNFSPGQLKIMTQSDQMSRAARMMQKTIIESFAISDPVAGKIESDSRNDYQIGFVRLVISPGRAGLRNAERPFPELLNPLNSAKHHLMSANRRIQNPFSRLKRCSQEQLRISFVVSRCIQSYTISISILIKGEQVELGSATGCAPGIMTERTALCQ
jgi:hypothetical protein